MPDLSKVLSSPGTTSSQQAPGTSTKPPLHQQKSRANNSVGHTNSTGGNNGNSKGKGHLQHQHAIRPRIVKATGRRPNITTNRDWDGGGSKAMAD